MATGFNYGNTYTYDRDNNRVLSVHLGPEGRAKSNRRRPTDRTASNSQFSPEHTYIVGDRVLGQVNDGE